jgi:HAMP domain-containing protein
MRFFDNFKILLKLAIPVGVLVAVAAGLVLLASASLTRLTENTQIIVDVSARRAVLAFDMALAVDEATIREKNIIIENDAADRRKLADEFSHAHDRAGRAVSSLIALSDTPELRLINEQAQTLIKRYFAAAEHAIALALRGEREAAAHLSNTEARAARKEAVALLTKRVDLNVAALDTEKSEALSVAASARTTLLITAGLGLLVSTALLAALTLTGIVRPLNVMTNAMQRLAQGSLDVAVRGTERRDEIGSLARSLQVFKDNAIEIGRLGDAQRADSEA